MKKTILLLLASCSLYAQGQVKSPQQIQLELDGAEAQFQQAKTMFNPYYQGPLITPSATMTPVGFGNIQPYVFVKDNYAVFDKKRHSVSVPHSLINLNPQVLIQTGITDTMDMGLAVQAEGNWQDGHSGGGLGDLTITVGFPILRQTRYIPNLKFTIAETFPTGKYQHLNTNGLNLDATGAGSYQTTFALAFSKLLFWTTQHPINIRAYCGYVIPSVVPVDDFNAYGGGFGTDGVVKPGQTLNADFGLEYSISQRWVLAMDVVYTASAITKFHGIAGTAAVGTGYSDNLSLSPALEYNWNANLGILAGAWFSVYGRNSSNFASGVFTVSYSFP